MLSRSLLALAALVVAAPVAPALAQSSTIRIEPRAYYGAVVTVEQGVRVWRPLPPTRHMIINPTNAPVSVNVTDVNENINHNGGFFDPNVLPRALPRADRDDFDYPRSYLYGRPFGSRFHGRRGGHGRGHR